MPPSEHDRGQQERDDAREEPGAQTRPSEAADLSLTTPQETSSSPRDASKIKRKLGRLHRRTSHKGSDDAEVASTTPQVFFAPPVANATEEHGSKTSPSSPSSSFRRAANPEDDFIVTTHPFSPTTDKSLHGLAPFDSSLPWKTPDRVVGLGRNLVERHRVAFFDIETSGLRNTDPIICAALGFWLEHHPATMFHVKHYFIFHPRAEANMLRAMLSDLCAFDVLCTYNGKSFDVPRIKSRCNHLGLDAIGITRQRHADLVHTARRVLPKRNHKLNLATMEETLLDFARSHDLPGSEVPRRWHQFTASQDLSLLDEIRDHNLLDVVSLAALLEIFAQGGPGAKAGGMRHPSPPTRGQQALPLATTPAPAQKEAATRQTSAPGERIVQPPSQGQAMSPLQRKLARSYQLKAKSSEPLSARESTAPEPPAKQKTLAQTDSPESKPVVSQGSSRDVREDEREGQSSERPAASQQVGPRVAQLRAMITARTKGDVNALSRECLPLVMELVALDPHHTQGLRWMIACYEQLGATALARTIRARYDAQDPYA